NHAKCAGVGGCFSEDRRVSSRTANAVLHSSGGGDGIAGGAWLERLRLYRLEPLEDLRDIPKGLIHARIIVRGMGAFVPLTQHAMECLVLCLREKAKLPSDVYDLKLSSVLPQTFKTHRMNPRGAPSPQLHQAISSELLFEKIHEPRPGQHMGGSVELRLHTPDRLPK